ncbi:subclass B1 metallo-beta-lactamase [Chryseobacterium daecheongense]|uniref:subclass B1 metallo-beta-lactamase n=1 Tax=Chryseobacterium daecheongense TaxID=192389 RepID=UPI001FD67589|nr:subclass B1 metallo-beta-lactamase [Chryseobacterium daecheongense]UOU96689.1 subclass B1 metallo-beta-lactamase [Chryseobacterium daecheongense]
MKTLLRILFLFLATLTVSCNSQKSTAEKNKVVYKSDDLVIIKLSENLYQHISFLNTDSFGRVECNGMIAKDGNETVVFDTPSDDKSSAELIAWIKNDLHAKINAVVPTHFHGDCLAGLKEFNKNNIPSYANNKTIELAKATGANVPNHGFDNKLALDVGSQKVYVTFFGEGHTKDNVVGYFPKEKAMFGGCLIKEVDATEGYLGDANVQAWSATVEKVKAQYPDVKTVIPGHGVIGGTELLDYTIKLFKNN